MYHPGKASAACSTTSSLTGCALRLKCVDEWTRHKKKWRRTQSTDRMKTRMKMKAMMALELLGHMVVMLSAGVCEVKIEIFLKAQMQRRAAVKARKV